MSVVTERSQRRREAAEPIPDGSASQRSSAVDISPGDPILAYFQSAPGPVELDKLNLDSPGLEALKASGVKLVVPLVSQGELIGLLNLGPRLSEQEYSSEDRKLLDTLAAHAAPALRLAQVVREQEAEARERERYDAEMRVATLIQQNLLPRQTPDLPGWQVAAHYHSAREVGGDFYDFIHLPDGRVGLVCGDVTDKGVPAAMVMASTRSVLRAAAVRLTSPGDTLAVVNDEVCPDMPSKMFVTCLYAILDPQTGHLTYANAGHNTPYVCSPQGRRELRARGMPLGLIPGSSYEEFEATIGPGETILLHSDGLAEAHDPDGDMFGFPRVQEVMRPDRCGQALIDALLTELDRFVGPDWEQEDDITLVVLTRTSSAADFEGARELSAFSVASEPGREREAMERISSAVTSLGLAPARLEKLKTAVAEATMNAIEHGNENVAEVPVDVTAETDGGRLVVRITDRGGYKAIPEADDPDLDAKLAGEQTPRGWGLFLIRNMVDELHTTTDGELHTIELVVNLEEGDDGTRG